jgi:hypothetical protein
LATGPDARAIEPDRKFIPGEPTKPATNRDEQGFRSFIEHIRRGVLLDPAGPHHCNAGGEGHRLDLVVRDVDDRRGSALVQALQLDPHLAAQLGIEIGQRLVEQEHLGLLHQRPSDRDALTLTAGELRRLAIEHPADL